MSHVQQPTDAPRRRISEALRFTDANGASWCVAECMATHVPGARAPRCLIFQSESVVRRLWRYPDDWRTLTPAALEALMCRP